MNADQRRNLLFILSLALMTFALLFLVNRYGAHNERVLFLLQKDENMQYPYLKHMLTPAKDITELKWRWISYGHYYYGYPFYLYSAVVVLPVTWLYGGEFIAHTQINLMLLRQMVSVLPMLASIVILIYLQTRFNSLIKSAILYLFLISVYGVMFNNVQWWHPDALALLMVVLTIFFLDCDQLRFGKHFYLAAFTCGLATGIKVIGVFFVFTISAYILAGLISKKVDWKKVVIKAFLFILIMSLTVILSNPLLLKAPQRERIIQVQKEQNYYVTQGWDANVEWHSGLSAWLPELEKWYGSQWFILFTLISLVVGCFFGKRRFTNSLILGWIASIGAYLLFFIVTSPGHYMLPVFLPLYSSVLSMTDMNFGNTKNLRLHIHNKAKTIQPMLTILICLVLGFQLIQNVRSDIFHINFKIDSEKLLFACNSSTINKTDGIQFELESAQWYVVEEFDYNHDPRIRKFLAIQGPGTVSASNLEGRIARECVNQEKAIFFAEKRAFYLKHDNPSFRVFGPDNVEVLP